MATVQEFIYAKLDRFGIQLTSVEMDVLLMSVGATDTTPCDGAGVMLAKRALVEVIPELLTEPDVSEGQYSRKRDRDGVLAYYALLCQELGVANKLSPQPTLSNASNRW